MKLLITRSLINRAIEEQTQPHQAASHDRYRDAAVAANLSLSNRYCNINLRWQLNSSKAITPSARARGRQGGQELVCRGRLELGSPPPASAPDGTPHVIHSQAGLGHISTISRSVIPSNQVPKQPVELTIAPIITATVGRLLRPIWYQNSRVK